MLLIEYVFFFFNDTATTEIYTLSLHDALPIWGTSWTWDRPCGSTCSTGSPWRSATRCTAPPTSCPTECSAWSHTRSEEHTSELQSRQYLVCRLLLEKKKRSISTTKSE